MDESQGSLLLESDSSILDPNESFNESFNLSNNSLLIPPTSNQTMSQRLQNPNLTQLTQENKIKNSLIGSQVKAGKVHYVDESMHMDSDTDNFEFSQLKISPSMTDINNFLDNSRDE